MVFIQIKAFWFTCVDIFLLPTMRSKFYLFKSTFRHKNTNSVNKNYLLKLEFSIHLVFQVVMITRWDLCITKNTTLLYRYFRNCMFKYNMPIQTRSFTRFMRHSLKRNLYCASFHNLATQQNKIKFNL